MYFPASHVWWLESSYFFDLFQAFKWRSSMETLGDPEVEAAHNGQLKDALGAFNKAASLGPRRWAVMPWKDGHFKREVTQNMGHGVAMSNCRACSRLTIWASNFHSWRLVQVVVVATCNACGVSAHREIEHWWLQSIGCITFRVPSGSLT